MSKYSYKKKILILFFSLIDLILDLFPRKKIILKQSYQKIIVVNLGHWGDLILTQPFLEKLRNNFPDAQIDILIGPWSQEIFSDNNYVNEVIIFPFPWYQRERERDGDLLNFFRLFKKLKSKKYDLFFDLKGDPLMIFFGFLISIQRRIGYGNGGLGRLLTDEIELNSNQHQIFNNLDLLKPLHIHYVKDGVKLKWSIKENFLIKVGSFFNNNYIKIQNFIIVVHPGAGHPSKIWPEEYWKNLISRLLNISQVKIIFIGAKNENQLLNEITQGIVNDNLIKLLGVDFSFLAAILFKSNLFIGSDSGPAHLAAAVGLPVVSIFSAANNPRRWQPFTKKLYLFYQDIFCKDCQKKNCFNKYCLRSIRPDDVFEAVWQIITTTGIFQNRGLTPKI